MAVTGAHGTTGTAASPTALWAVTLGPPVIWAVRFGLAYVLVPFACRADALPLLHAITLVSLAATAALGWLAWRYRQRADRHEDAGEQAAAGRIRFMAGFGMLGSLLFAIVIAAEGAANLMIDPCLASGPLVP